MGHQALPLGFRFSPTDEELVAYYLRRKTVGQAIHGAPIAVVDIYKCEPWDLPERSTLPSKDQEWYFFSAQDKKYSQTARINRTTRKGYWKATGKDRKVYSESCIIGLKKTLIYYEGRAPNGKRTNWVMHEYRLDEETEKKETIICPAVLCRIRKKGGLGPRNGDQYGAPVSYDDIESGVGDFASSLGKAKQERGQSVDGDDFPSVGDHIEDLKPPSGHLGAPKVLSEHRDAFGADALVSKEMHTASSSWPISDDTQVASFERTFSFGGHDEETFSYVNQLIDMPDDNIASNLSTLSPLPSVSDVDVEGLYDYIFPAVGEEQIIGEMWGLLNASDQRGVTNVTLDDGLISQPLSYNYGGPITGVGSLASGGFIELDDMRLPLDGNALESPMYSSEFSRPEGLEFCPLSPEVGETSEILQSQGVATRRMRLQVPVHGGKAKDFHVNYPGSGLNDSINMVEGSTRSFLAKHMSTYMVSKCELMPAQACRAALMLVEDEDVTSRDSSQSLTTAALVMRSKSSVDAEALECSPLVSSDSRSIQNDKLSDVKALHGRAKPSSHHHQSWKMAFRELVSWAKKSTWGSRLLSLEGHVRARFDHNVSILGKPVSRLLPGYAEDRAGPYDFLKKGVVLTLCHLVVAVLIIFCVFWGYHLLRKHSVSVSV